VDSNALHADAWRRAFEHFGIEVGMDEAWSQIGKGGDQLIPVFVPEADRDRLEPQIKAFRKEVFHRDYLPSIVSFAKVREKLMQTLRGCSYGRINGARTGKGHTYCSLVETVRTTVRFAAEDVVLSGRVERIGKVNVVQTFQLPELILKRLARS
jgi:hypothetical protein